VERDESTASFVRDAPTYFDNTVRTIARVTRYRCPVALEMKVHLALALSFAQQYNSMAKM
jgi:hypothetical protein